MSIKNATILQSNIYKVYCFSLLWSCYNKVASWSMWSIYPFNIASQTPGQSHDCPSANSVSLMQLFVMCKFQITLRDNEVQSVYILYNRNGNQLSCVSPVTAYISLKLRACCNKINSSKIKLQYGPCKNMFIHHIHSSCQVGEIFQGAYSHYFHPVWKNSIWWSKWEITLKQTILRMLSYWNGF